MLRAPATSFAQAMAKNGNLLLFETEGDTVVNTFNSDFSKYSDSFRKAFARESFGYLRRDDDRGKRNRKPSPGHRPFRHARAGAPLIKDSENGLLLRFMFFCINSTPEWLDGFSSSGSDVPLVETFDEFGAEFTAFTKLLVDTPQTQLSLSLPQIGMFNDFFTAEKDRMQDFNGDRYSASSHHLAWCFIRIAVVLTALRLMDFGAIS